MNDLDRLYKAAPLYRELFLEQLQFALSPSRYTAALCSRRAGKTTVCAVYALQELMTKPDTLGLYLALTDRSVKTIIVPIVRPLVKKYKLNCTIKEDEIVFSNGSMLCIYGANHINKIEGFRGTKLSFCIIDEAASFKEDILQYLIDEIILYALSDLGGRLMLIGTPAAHCSGMFYRITKKLEGVGVWDMRKWTAFQNPHQRKQHEIIIDDICRSKMIDNSHPKIRREGYGEWCADDESLMIRQFAVAAPPVPYNREGWRTVVGVDFGFNDETAFSVIGWQHHNPKAYILECYGVSQMGVNSIAQHLKRLKETYNPISIVGDPAGASKIIMAEFSEKYHIFLKSAQKTNKAHYVEILSDALLNTELVVTPQKTEKLQEQFQKLVWNEDRTRELEGQSCGCDQFDATLYCYREARAYLEKIPTIKPMTDKDKEKKWIELQLQKDQEVAAERAGDPFFQDVYNYLGDEYGIR